MIRRTIPWKARPKNPKINKSNGIGRKVDFYAPLHDAGVIDVSGKLSPSTTSGISLEGGSKGLATHFDANDYISYGDVHDIGLGSIFYGVWFKTVDTGNYNLISKSFYGSANNRFYLNFNGGNLQAFVEHNTWPYDVSVTNAATVDDGEWHFALASLERGVGLTLYIDGVNVGFTANTNTDSNTSSGYHLLVGRYNDGADGTNPVAGDLIFEGEMSDMVLGHHSLNDVEARSLYNNFYQILQPRTQLIDLTAAAAPPSGLISTKYYNQELN